MSEFSVSFAIGIVAHHSRIDQAKRLYDEVQADVIEIDDTNRKLGCEANHRRVWQALSQIETEWLVVLEDDAMPVSDFRNQLHQALTAAPTPVVSLYLGRQRPPRWQDTIAHHTTKADANNAHWITTDTALHAVGLAIRTPHAHQYLEHIKHRNGWYPPDQALGHWARTVGHAIAYTWPSLVDHLDIPTVIAEHRDGSERIPGRKAWRTGGHQQWNSDVVEMMNPMLTRKR
jgi:GR25 family glycosyltransferase involved in LPS biosynthesis